MNRKLSRHDRINAVVVGQKVEEYKGRHAYLHAMSRHREEYGSFWLRSDKCSFGHGFGRMMGFKEMVPAWFGKPLTAKGEEGAPDAFAAMANPTGLAADEKKVDRPTKAADIFGPLEIYGHNDKGTFAQSAHVIASGVIEVADDGKSARAAYLTPGTMMGCNGDRGGRNGSWMWERYGSDFVYRDGKWWWFHEQVLPDIEDKLDTGNWAQDLFVKYMEGKYDPAGAIVMAPPGISDKRRAHSEVSIVQTVQDTTPPPKPYAKMDEDHTYSPGMSDFSGPLYPNTQSYGDSLY